jgi:hypothetical protein
MFDKIKKNPETLIRIGVVIILLILIIVFSEGNLITTFKSLIIGYGIGLTRIIFVLCTGLLFYKIFQFFRLKYWTISTKDMKLLIFLIAISLVIMIGFKIYFDN